MRVSPSSREGTLATVSLWWSTGKDSAWALHRLIRDPNIEVERLITTITPAFGRVAIHGTRVEILEAQAEAVGLPVERVELPYPCSNAEYEAAVEPVVRQAEAEGVNHMAFGDLFLEDVRAYRERLLEGTSISPIFPIWGQDTHSLAAQMLEEGVEAFITSLDPRRLDASLAGARFDAAFLEALPGSVDPCGENGEFHTCVTAGPVFRESLELRVGEVVERSGFLYADLLADGGLSPGSGGEIR